MNQPFKSPAPHSARPNISSPHRPPDLWSGHVTVLMLEALQHVAPLHQRSRSPLRTVGGQFGDHDTHASLSAVPRYSVSRSDGSPGKPQGNFPQGF